MPGLTNLNDSPPASFTRFTKYASMSRSRKMVFQFSFEFFDTFEQFGQ